MKFLRNIMLGCFGLAFLTFAGYGLIADVLKTANRKNEASLAERLAAEAKAELVAEKGWFPALKNPIFSWEEDLQGWVLEGAASSQPPPILTSSGAEDPPSTAKNAGFEKEDVQGKGEIGLRISARHVSSGKHSLSIPVHFPDPATIYISWDRLRSTAPGEPKPPPKHTVENVPEGLLGCRFYSFDVFLPETATGYIGCLLFLKDKDGRWFQARSQAALRPGRWTTITADIRGGSRDVEPLGHLGQWDENQASQIRTLGLTFYGAQPFRGHLWVDNFKGWMRKERFAKIVQRRPVDAEEGEEGVSEKRRPHLENLLKKVKPVQERAPLVLLNLRTSPASTASSSGAPLTPSPPTVGRYSPFTISFELNRQIYNPFDNALADIRATVEAPSGAKTEVFGFWYQDFERKNRFANDDLQPVGRPQWQVRITPRELGPHAVTITARLNPGKDDAEEVISPPLNFACVPSENRGFISVSKRNPHFFEFEDGSPFYPIGHNVHSPVDLRCWEKVFKQPVPLQRGLRMYEDFFKKMAKAGENVGEVWMSSWWLGIEWTKKWRHYHGMGRYSLEHAWKLDKVFEWAQKNNIKVHLVIDNHGKFSQWCDWEWDLNPFNRFSDGNGPVTRPSEYFTNAKCRDHHKKRLRYIAARWGADPALLGWELVSEMDLVGDGQGNDPSRAGNPTHPQGRNYFRTNEPQAWTREMLAALRACDAYNHPVTNHYATDVTWIDMALANTPVFDYVVGDAYRSQTGYADMALQWASYMASQLTHKKPYWVTEYGGNWDATSMPRLEADLHSGLWSTWMTDAAGTPLLWWYDFIDHADLYFHYRAFAHYAQGEDRRELDGVTRTVFPSKNNINLRALAYQWKNGAYVWVYNVIAMGEMPAMDQRPGHFGVEVPIAELEAGTYRIEFWDTYEGKVVDTKEQTIQTGALIQLRFPDFLSDMAVKIKFLGPVRAANTSSGR